VSTFSLGIDIGGTFTDVVLSGEAGILGVGKHLTTPTEPALGAISATRAVLAEAGVEPSAIRRVVHGTTLAANTVLEHKGGIVALVTTKGFRHLLTLGRHARVEEERYDLAFDLPEPPVALPLTFELAERLDFRGNVLQPLDDVEVGALAGPLANDQIVGVAVCLLHSYANPVHELRVASILRPLLRVPVVLSSEVWPEFREYDRTTTTVMSAIVRPVMESYLADLEARLHLLGIDAELFIMESAGGVMSVQQAISRAIGTVESGPAAGVVAAKVAGQAGGHADVIAFDMGGTTAKAAVIRGGEPDITHDFQLGGRGSYGVRRSGTGVPIQIPTIDLAEVGAGGGSIAWLDAEGTLHVGPLSAGADPGPACYGLGGEHPTVTDANVVLGYLDLGRARTQLPFFDPTLSAWAIQKRIGDPLGVSAETAAAAIYDIANAMMAGAIHTVTVQRGIDPRSYALVTTGGAGPLHAARMAEGFGIETVIVPSACGVASAVGLLASDLRTDLVRSIQVGEDDVDFEAIEADYRDLEGQAAATLNGQLDEPLEYLRSVEIRYRRQAHNLTLSLDGEPLEAKAFGQLRERFFVAHEVAFGVGRPGPIELVNLRLRATRGVEPTSFHRVAAPLADQAATVRSAWSHETKDFVIIPVTSRVALEQIGAGEGPILVEDPEATVFVPPGWRAEILSDGALRLGRIQGQGRGR
jgi:N-methylhydantoinase A